MPTATNRGNQWFQVQSNILTQKPFASRNCFWNVSLVPSATGNTSWCTGGDAWVVWKCGRAYSVSTPANLKTLFSLIVEKVLLAQAGAIKRSCSSDRWRKRKTWNLYVVTKRISEWQSQQSFLDEILKALDATGNYWGNDDIQIAEKRVLDGKWDQLRGWNFSSKFHSELLE